MFEIVIEVKEANIDKTLASLYNQFKAAQL